MAIQPTPELIRAIQNYKKGQRQAFEVLYRSSLPYLTKSVLNVITARHPVRTKRCCRIFCRIPT